jgi:transposase
MTLAADPRKVVFIDESATNLNMQRDYAYSPVGLPTYVQGDKRQGEHVSLLASLSLDGVTSSLLVKGSVDTEVFLHYLSHELIPSLQAGQIIILDNCPIHAKARIEALLAPIGVRLWMLPAYSPDLSPIELFFSKLKSILKACQARCLQTLSAAVKQAIDATTLSDIMGWFRECGYPAH